MRWAGSRVTLGEFSPAGTDSVSVCGATVFRGSVPGSLPAGVSGAEIGLVALLLALLGASLGVLQHRFGDKTRNEPGGPASPVAGRDTNAERCTDPVPSPSVGEAGGTPARSRNDTLSTGSGGDSSNTRSATDDASDGTTTAVQTDDRRVDPDSPVEPDGDEARVLALLDTSGGRVKQSRIVTETGWSKAKVSMLLSEMHDRDLITKLRLGRENVIYLDGEEPEIALPLSDERRE